MPANILPRPCRVHQGELPWPPSVGNNRGRSEFAQLTAVDEGFHHVLLNVVRKVWIVPSDAPQPGRASSLPQHRGKIVGGVPLLPDSCACSRRPNRETSRLLNAYARAILASGS